MFALVLHLLSHCNKSSYTV